jgi:DNA-binding MarR family transcriptional regulator
VSEYVLLSSDYLTTISLILAEVRKRLNRDGGLSLPRFSILDSLDRNCGKLRTKDLAAWLGCSANTLTYHLDCLERDFCVSRARDEDDRRTVLVRLTPQGEACHAQAAKAVRAAIAQALLPLGDFLKTYVLDVARSGAGGTKMSRESSLAFIEASVFFSALYFGERVRAAIALEQLTIKDFRVLFELREHSGGISCHDLARVLLLPLPDLSAILNKLTATGLVLRHEDSLDRRVTLAELNSDGFGVIARCGGAIDELLLSGIGSAIGKTSDEMYQLLGKATTLIARGQRAAFRV